MEPLPPHGHEDGSVHEEHVTPDGRTVSVVPDWPAPEGTEVTYFVDPTFRRYRMVDGEWRAIGSAGGGGWTVVSEGTFTGDFTVTDLEGDTDLFYHLLIREYNVISAVDVALQFNGDTGANYNSRLKYGAVNGGVTADAINFLLGQTELQLNRYSQYHLFASVFINAKQGNQRLVTGTLNGNTGINDSEATTVSGEYISGASELSAITVMHPSTPPTEGHYVLLKMN